MLAAGQLRLWRPKVEGK
uniref:Uncharacterized protein n=1 Tax=Arundo donax TaxID=35708 RepID=A0A0A9HSS5_ARUDO